MAVLSLVELLKMTPDPVAQGVIEHIITVDQLSANLPRFSVGLTDHISFDREKALPVISKPLAGGSITADATLENTKVSSYCRRMVGDQDIDVLNSGAVGGMKRARAFAVGQAAKAMARTFGDDIIDGNSNFTATINSYGGTGYTAATIVVGPGHDPRMPVGIIRYTHSGTTVKYKAPGDAEFGAAVSIASGVKIYSDNEDKWVTLTTSAGSASANGDIVFTISAGDEEVDGVERLVAASQTISSTAADGDAIALATLDQLADLVTDSNGPKVYFCNRSIRRKIAALLRAAGGATMSEWTSEIFQTGNPTRYPTYNGIPILCTDFIDNDESKGSASTLSSVYCATLGEMAGLAGIWSDASLDAEDDGELIARVPGGITVLNLGTVQNSDSKRVRVKAYWGLKNASEKGLARAKEIISA